MTQIQFDDGSGRRIGNAVRWTEVQAAKRNPLLFDSIAGTSKKVLSVGTFVGSWPEGQWKTVTIYGSGQTVSVYNWTTPVLLSAECEAEENLVVFGKASGTQSLVEVGLHPSCAGGNQGGTCVLSFAGLDLAALPGYSANSIQMLGHNTTGPCLQWYSITTCATATA